MTGRGRRPPGTPPRDLAGANDAAALAWAGPFGYAVLQALRKMDRFGEADFWGFMDLAPRSATPPRPPLPPLRVVPEGGPPVRARRPALEPPPPVAPTAVAGRVLEPAPPPEFYKRVTKANFPAAPGGRDASGRAVRPIK